MTIFEHEIIKNTTNSVNLRSYRPNVTRTTGNNKTLDECHAIKPYNFRAFQMSQLGANSGEQASDTLHCCCLKNIV